MIRNTFCKNKFSYVMFGTRKSTLFLASRFLGMWSLAIWMPKNVIIPLFGFIWNLLSRGDHGSVRVGFVLNPQSTRPSWVPNFQTRRRPISKSDRTGRFLPEWCRVTVGVDYLENGENPAKKIWKTIESNENNFKNGRNPAWSHQIQRNLGHFQQDLG